MLNTKAMIAAAAAAGGLIIGGVAMAAATDDTQTIRVAGVDVGSVQPTPTSAASGVPTPVTPAPGATPWDDRDDDGRDDDWDDNGRDDDGRDDDDRRPVAASAGPEQVVRAAEAAVGPGARAVEIDSDDDGPKAWEVDVIAADGVKYEVELDSAARVLRVTRDD